MSVVWEVPGILSLCWTVKCRAFRLNWPVVSLVPSLSWAVTGHGLQRSPTVYTWSECSWGLWSSVTSLTSKCSQCSRCSGCSEWSERPLSWRVQYRRLLTALTGWPNRWRMPNIDAHCSLGSVHVPRAGEMIPEVGELGLGGPRGKGSPSVSKGPIPPIQLLQ